MEDSAVDAAARPLRIAAVVSFVPSFALCIAHGVLSHNPVPAVGLVPQAVSVVTSIALLRTAGHRQEADVESLESEGRSGISIRAVLTHPIVWVAWQILPPDCPNCEHHLRPSSLPEIPWYQSVKNLNLGLRFPWRRSDAPLLAPLLAEDDPERYRDDPEDDVTPLHPEAVEVRSKRNRKNATPAPSNEALDPVLTTGDVFDNNN
ncbi:hypothetical protein THARTR1_01536 [Trichoderma harzianum]|uniref:Uncharacterized protein n=1 Tax=Trichoderma harzianum TaxID=5544 RepID=A0A2K0UL68_TRIHA|nr:hypothetical protein THARTR1_01536 [Trichoderma harzianum]